MAPAEGGIYRQHDKVVHRGRDQDKRNHRVDKVSYQEFAAVDLKLNSRKIRFPTIAAISG